MLIYCDRYFLNKIIRSARNYSCLRGYSENEKDCPVCRVKNVQLVDALQAQNESRVQHEMFHNLLDRSRDAFSVVTE